jgi:hypothetical protein
MLDAFDKYKFCPLGHMDARAGAGASKKCNVARSPIDRAVKARIFKPLHTSIADFVS